MRRLQLAKALRDHCPIIITFAAKCWSEEEQQTDRQAMVEAPAGGEEKRQFHYEIHRRIEETSQDK